MANKETLESATRLVGEINSVGIAALKVDQSVLQPPGSGGSTDTSRLSVLDHSGDDWSGTPSSVDEDEDYDALRLRPETTIDGSRGGGVEKEPALGRSAIDAADITALLENGKTKSYEAIRTSAPSSPKLHRRTSIHVTLEKTDKKGRYILTADDPTIREVLRRGIEREEAALDPKKPRTRFRDLVFTRQFTAFDGRNPVSQSPFQGFFTLFWLTIGLLLLKIAAQNYRVHGSVFGGKELLNIMFERDVIVLGLADGVMVGVSIVGLLLQKIILKGYLTWNGAGWIIQHIWQTFYLFAVVGWTLYREWPWTHTIFIVLHGIVFLMKQHSYAFYNGHLSQVYRRKCLLEEKLDQLDNIDPVTSPFSSPTTSPGAPSSVSTGSDKNQEGLLSKRRRSSQARVSTNLKSEQSEIAPIARAIEEGTPLDAEQLATFSSIVRNEIRSLNDELKGKCTATEKYYPRNLTLANWVDWTVLPTLVYELEYPRVEKINWWYVAEKTAAVFGVIWVMMVISQAYIYPSVAQTVHMKEAGMTLPERWREFPWIVSDILFPLLLEQLLSWYVIWECCLNVLAELTRFADRGFYGDWWNSRSWDQYARDWNRPVHNFLLRHVYHSSISALHLNKASATFVTFLLSALVHELVMWCLFKKFRGYLFCMQLAQIPLTMLGRTKLLKGKDTLNNISFWLGMICGPALITSLYLIV